MDASALRQEIDQLCNDLFDTVELRRYFARPLTWPAERTRMAMLRRYFVPTNRDCWAYVMGGAPLDVKRAIWEHEQDELIFDPRLGAAHVDADRAPGGASPGPSARDAAIEAPPGVRVATFARVEYARHSPWLAGLAASHVLERINDPSVIQGPALVQRQVNHLIEDLGVPPDQIPPRLRVHLDADVEHARSIWGVFEQYVRDAASYAEALAGARMGLDCFRVYAGAVGDLMVSAARDE
ncbi:MAG TPA: hypothetical protein VK066_30585 [Chloroflexota bacterium]|nr:hypothetical protein [Chloroflexota bacterium]